MTALHIEAHSDRPAVGRQRPPVRRWVWMLSFAMDVAALAGAWWAGIPMWPPVALCSVVVLHGALLLPGWRATRRRPGLPRASSVRRRWLVDDAGIQVHGDGSSLGWRWPAVMAVKETRSAYLFVQKGGGPNLDLPRAALDATQDAALREFLALKELL